MYLFRLTGKTACVTQRLRYLIQYFFQSLLNIKKSCTFMKVFNLVQKTIKTFAVCLNKWQFYKPTFQTNLTFYCNVSVPLDLFQQMAVTLCIVVYAKKHFVQATMKTFAICLNKFLFLDHLVKMFCI
jgi:hypothetical protein